MGPNNFEHHSSQPPEVQSEEAAEPLLFVSAFADKWFFNSGGKEKKKAEGGC